MQHDKYFAIFLILTSALMCAIIAHESFTPDLHDNSISDQEVIQRVFTSDNVVQDLYQMLKDVSEVFEIAKITYAIDGGTTLGSVRHQGLIPWDDDVDLVVMKEDEHKLLKLKSVLRTLGYNISYSKKLMFYKIYKINNPVRLFDEFNAYGIFESITFPFIDIFIIHHDKLKRIVELDNEWTRSQWPAEWFPEDRFFPLAKKYKFGPLTLRGPNDAEWYLTNLYGESWKTTAVIFKHDFKHYRDFGAKKALRGVYQSTALPQHPLIDNTKAFRDEIVKAATDTN